MVLRKTGTLTSDGDDSDSDERTTIAAAGVLAGSAQHEYGDQDPYRLDGVRGSYDGERHAALAQNQSVLQGGNRALAAPVETQSVAHEQQPASYQQQQQVVPRQQQQQATPNTENVRHNSSYGDWMVPAAGGVAAGAGAGVLDTEAYKRHQRDATVPETEGVNSPVSPLGKEDRVVAAAVVPANGPSATNTSATAYAAVPTKPTISEELAKAAETRRESPGIVGLSDTATPVTSLPTKPSFGDRNNIDGVLSGATPPATTDALASPPTTATALATSTTTTAARNADEGLGGNERVGAHETGDLFPRVIRHDTSLSVSALHVPGEFPAR